MENIDVQATLELVAAIGIVVGLAATFFKKTKSTPAQTVEEVPYKVEAPVVEVDQVRVVEAAEASAIPAKAPRKPRVPKAEVAKKPATKKTIAKKKLTK